VFWWVLLTAGTICFPIAVFSFFCLRQKWKVQKIENQYLYDDPSKKKNIERGFLGPYAESKESLQGPSKMPEIVVQPYGVSNKVRFQEDNSSQLPALMTPAVEEFDGPADLRGLKNAVNYFGKGKKQQQQNHSTRSNTSGQPNRYVQNPIQQGQDINIQDSQQENQNGIYSSPDAPIVYSVASSQPQVYLFNE